MISKQHHLQTWSPETKKAQWNASGPSKGLACIKSRPRCQVCRIAAVKFSHETVWGSRHVASAVTFLRGICCSFLLKKCRCLDIFRQMLHQFLPICSCDSENTKCTYPRISLSPQTARRLRRGGHRTTGQTRGRVPLRALPSIHPAFSEHLGKKQPKIQNHNKTTNIEARCGIWIPKTDPKNKKLRKQAGKTLRRVR